MQYGTVVAVEKGLLGSSLVIPLLATDTVLTVDHTADFNEDGGLLLVAGATLTYTALDEDAGLIYLAAAAGVTADVSEPVQVIEAGTPMVQWYAHVALVDADDDSTGDTVPAELPTALVGYFPEGSYDNPVPVELELVRGTYRVTSQPQTAPTLQGSVVLDPTSVPPARDGVVPAAVATVTTLGGLGLIFVKWSVVTTNANGDPQTAPVRYRVYGAPSGSPLPLDATTLLAETAGTMAAVKYLADGTPFAYDTSYAFVVQAYDEDGNAAASPTTNGAMDRAASGDLAVGSVTAATLASVVILGTTISTRTLDANGNLTGPGIDLTPTGLFTYDQSGNKRVEMPDDPNLPNVFRGDAEIDHLTVATLTTLQATLLSQGSTLTMAMSVAAPSNPPTITVGYDTAQYDVNGDWSKVYGWNLCPDTLGVVRRAWLQTNYPSVGFPGFTIWRDLGSSYAGWNAQPTESGDAWQATNFVMAPDNSAPYVIFYSTLHAGWYLTLAASVNADRRYWALSGAGSPQGTGVNGWAPALTRDPATGEFIYAQSYTSDGKVHIRRFTLPAGSTTIGAAPAVTWGADLVCATAFAYHLRYLMFGTFDMGASRYVFGTDLGSALVQVVDTAGVLDTTQVWDAPSGVQLRGMLWDGSNFRAVSSTGMEYKFENGNKWSASADATWYAAYSWRNANTPAETTLSPAQAFTMKRRAKLTVKTTAVASGATEARVYLAKGATAPNVATASMTLQGSTTGTSTPSRVITAATFTPLNNLTVSSFGTGTPATLVSQASDGSGPLVKLSGDGSGRVGPWAWDATGKDTKGLYSDTGWLELTAGTGYTKVFAHYRKIGPVVYLRFLISNNAAVSFANTGNVTGDPVMLSTLPVGYRPSDDSIPVFLLANGRAGIAYMNNVGVLHLAAFDGYGTASTLPAGSNIFGNCFWFTDS